MERVISAVYKDGVFKPLEPVTLEDGSPVQVTYNEPPKSKARVLGLRPGSIWMSDDFDDPLPDEFWHGEE